jgi:uncharacterized membrane protein
MNDLIILLVTLMLLAMILAALVLPIIALVVSVRSRNKLNQHEARLAAAVQQLEARINAFEAAQTISFPDTTASVARAPSQPATQSATVPPAEVHVPVEIGEPVPEVPQVPITPPPSGTIRTEQLESIIGRRWVGWAAVCVILFAAAFFLKYAFDNRWIGELGRVAIGVAAGIGMTAVGFKFHRRGWRVFSQILTGGGIVLLYLSAYAAFGYYHLATQTAAFCYLAILVGEAALLAYLYNVPAIAIMALLGGFLNPILLRSDRDQYRSLFGYIFALDLGALALLRHWPGLSSLAFAGTHLLFWVWYGDNYHPRKIVAVMIFQTAVFLLFLLAHLGRQLVRRQAATFEDLALLAINPFVFFATSYHLLNRGHHDWMGVFAICMALLYAGAAKILLERATSNRSESLLIIAVALTFVTIAMPIQLRQNWITIAWSVEGLLMLWVGLETKAQRLQASAHLLFGLALIRLIFWDTPGESRPMFTLVLNKYFLSSIIVTACLFGATVLYQKSAARKQVIAPVQRLIILLVAIVTLWLVMSVETHTFFAARATAQKLVEDASHERWLGQMALSVLWSAYAGALAAIGFVRRSATVRWASLALFALTVLKAMMVDLAQLQQFYRIIVFFVLGMLLLVVAWGYNKAFRATESSK